MRTFLIILSLTFVGLPSFANEGYCSKQALEEVMLHHNAKLDKIGVIQGYEEDISMTYSKKQSEMDQLDETYTFEVMGSNDEEEWWVTKYQVKYETWLSAGLTNIDCRFMGMTYFGVVDQSVWEE